MNQFFEQAFNDVFSNPASCMWRQGYSDALNGKRASSNDKNYIEGYGVGYEKGEKESANTNQRII